MKPQASTPNFLRDVAEFFASGQFPVPQEDLVYVLPNKRAGMFLKRHIHNTMTRVSRMPQIRTLHSFLSRLANLAEAPQRSRMFMLYDAYRTVTTRRNPAQKLRPFDSFIFWGDMVLNDFDEIDKAKVNPEDIFRNLKNLKEIQADYLTDEQKAAIERIWGESRLTGSTKRFWLHVSDEQDSLGQKFVYIWEILAEVYAEYKAILARHTLGSPGEIYLRAYQAVQDLGPDSLPERTHYVFVGFNDASTVETLIFERLKKLGIASFVWDTAPLELFGAEPGKALGRLQRLVRAFPPPEGFVTHGLPIDQIDIDVYAVPSAIFQTKELSKVLAQWVDDGDTDGANAINSAVVLPDQSLLLPTLMSVPDSIEKLNVSMGLNFRSTSFASLLQSLVSMQLRSRTIRGERCFFFEDVSAVLNHPHVRHIDGVAADRTLAQIKKLKSYNVASEWLVAQCPSLAELFAPLRDSQSVSEVADYLTALLRGLRRGLAVENAASPSFEIRLLDYLESEVKALAELAGDYGVEMGDRTFLRLFERMLNYTGVPANGTPLAGLQILGVLETRTLDFENVAILSMNEAVFPRRQYGKTMIPNSLRAGYGLPDSESLEVTYAYCFYRLLARARHAALFYDSRSGATGPGEMSRYITRLLYLVPELKITRHTVSVSSQLEKPEDIVIEKTEPVLEMLGRMLPPGPLFLSASALKTYKECPLKFFLSYIGGLREDTELVDWLNSADHGNIVHSTIQRAIQSLGPRPITASDLEKLASPTNTALARIAVEEIANAKYQGNKELPVEGRIALRAVLAQVRNDLISEKNSYCSDGHTFTFVSSEETVKTQWNVGDGLTVNWRMNIDMVERADNGNLRFIDYKTGKDKSSMGILDDIATDTGVNGAGLQLLAYCQAYLDTQDPNAVIEPRLHILREMAKEKSIKLIKAKVQGADKAGEVKIDTYDQVADHFAPALYELIHNIFDPAIPITQAEKNEACRNCRFIDACGRTVPEEKY